VIYPERLDSQPLFYQRRVRGGKERNVSLGRHGDPVLQRGIQQHARAKKLTAAFCLSVLDVPDSAVRHLEALG
jgi:hypothetical protein